MKNFSLLVCITMLSGVLLWGCEASKGAGKDLENTGKNIQETVEKTIDNNR